MKFLITFTLLLFSFLGYSANKTYQAIDTNGNVLFTIEAERVYAFSDGLARIQQLNLVNNQWVRGSGYINTKGEVVIPCVYDKVHDFVDGRAWVKRENESHWILIDSKGNVIPTKKYEKVGHIMEGYSDRIAVYNNGAMGWIDRDGNEVISCQYIGSSTFDKEFGLACVSVKGGPEKYGFINKQGEIVIPFQYKQAGHSSFKNGYCRVSVSGKTVLIDETGTIKFRPTYNSLQNYSHGLMAVATKPNRKGWGYCNLENEMVVAGKYSYASTLNADGYGIVEADESKGLINPEGKIIIPLKYATIYADVSQDGYICGVHQVDEPTSLSNTPKDYFDSDLNPVDVGNATLMSADGGNRIPFTIDRKRGYMDRNFKIIVPAKYKKATAFSDGIALVRE